MEIHNTLIGRVLQSVQCLNPVNVLGGSVHTVGVVHCMMPRNAYVTVTLR